MCTPSCQKQVEILIKDRGITWC